MTPSPPTPEAVTGVFDEALAWYKKKVAEIEAKLPEGVKLSDTDLGNIADQGIGKFGADFWRAFTTDLLGAIKRGSGPNEFDHSHLG